MHPHRKRLPELLFLLAGPALTYLMLWATGHGFPILINACLVPFLYSVYTRKPLQLTLLCPLYGTGFACSVFPWVYSYNYLIFLESILGFSLFFLLFSITLLRCGSLFPTSIQLVTPAIAWIAISLGLQNTPIGSYWLELSIYQSTLGFLTRLIGGTGITFLIVVLNTSLALWLLSAHWRQLRPALIIGCLFLTGWLDSAHLPAGGQSIAVALIQGNVSEPWLWRQRHAYHPIFDIYSELTLSAEMNSPDIIVWPEYAIPIDIQTHNQALMEKVRKLSSHLKGRLVIGTITSAGNGNHYDASLIFQHGELIDSYASLRPFAFNEGTIPGKNMIRAFGGGPAMGISLCFEECLPSIFNEYTRKGAAFFVSMVNTQDFAEGSTLSLLHSRLRAAETARYIVRAANTGITAIIAPNGEIIQRLQENMPGVLMGRIRVLQQQTMYSIYGDWMLLPLLALSFLISITLQRGETARQEND